MSAYKRTFRLALHAWRILSLQIIFALLERSAAVDSGFHAALFVPTLCICKEFIMLHEKWYLWCSFLYFFARARCHSCVAMYLGERDRTAWLQLHGSHAKIQLVVKLDIPPRACALPGEKHAGQVTF